MKIGRHTRVEPPSKPREGVTAVGCRMPIWLTRYLPVLAPWGKTALAIILVGAAVVTIVGIVLALYRRQVTWRTALDGDDLHSERAMRMLVPKPLLIKREKVVIVEPQQQVGRSG
jgi:hypothetical protein